jgi:hypothetical protein
VQDGRQESDLEATHREEMEGAATGEGVRESGVQVDPVSEEERHGEGFEGGPEAGRQPLPQVAFEEGEPGGAALYGRTRSRVEDPSPERSGTDPLGRVARPGQGPGRVGDQPTDDLAPLACARRDAVPLPGKPRPGAWPRALRRDPEGAPPVPPGWPYALDPDDGDGRSRRPRSGPVPPRPRIRPAGADRHEKAEPDH